MEYERLSSVEGLIACQSCETDDCAYCSALGQAINRLREIEDMIESGELIENPNFIKD